MKFILFLVIVLQSFGSFGQKTKTIDIIKRTTQQEYVYVIHSFDNDNQITRSQVRFECQNSKYQHITNLITLFKGDYKEFYAYLSSLEKFWAKNEKEVKDGISITENINGQEVHMYKMSFILGLNVYSGDGYHSFTIKWIKKIKEQFVDWCKKNNVAYE